MERIPAHENEKEEKSNLESTNSVMNGHITSMTRQSQVETETQTIPTPLKSKLLAQFFAYFCLYFHAIVLMLGLS